MIIVDKLMTLNGDAVPRIMVQNKDAAIIFTPECIIVQEYPYVRWCIPTNQNDFRIILNALNNYNDSFY